MDAVQRMRAKAESKGTLKTSAQQTVQTETVEDGKQAIVISTASSDVVYVPSYDPAVVYGAAYPAYPYPPVYYPGDAAGMGLAFGTGLVLGAAGGGGWGYGCGWGNGNVNINNNNNYVNHYNKANNINRGQGKVTGSTTRVIVDPFPITREQRINLASGPVSDLAVVPVVLEGLEGPAGLENPVDPVALESLAVLVGLESPVVPVVLEGLEGPAGLENPVDPVALESLAVLVGLESPVVPVALVSLEDPVALENRVVRSPALAQVAVLARSQPLVRVVALARNQPLVRLVGTASVAAMYRRAPATVHSVALPGE